MDTRFVPCELVIRIRLRLGVVFFAQSFLAPADRPAGLNVGLGLALPAFCNRDVIVVLLLLFG
jgi:hypothetical protein